MNMMEENQTVDNIAKLEQWEFGLDLEELERLHNESEEEIEKVWEKYDLSTIKKEVKRKWEGELFQDYTNKTKTFPAQCEERKSSACKWIESENY